MHGEGEMVHLDPAIGRDAWERVKWCTWIPLQVGKPLCRLYDRLDDLISEPTRAVGVTVTAGTVTLIGLPRMAR